MNLYELNNEFIKLNELLEESEGELTPEIISIMALNKANFKELSDNYVRYIHNLKSDCKALDTEIARLQALKKSKSNIIERLKNNLQEFMLINDIRKYDLGIFKMFFRGSKSVEIIGEVPKEYSRISIEPDKVAIKKAIEENQPIDFAKLVSKENLIIQ